jgi:hypothetical protein
MLRVGEARSMDGWQDLLAAHRIGHLVAQGPTLVDQLVGISMSEIACQQTAVLLHESKLSADEARKISRDLSTLNEFSGLADCIDHFERVSSIDAIIRLAGANPEDVLGYSSEEGRILRHLHRFRIDWNVALRKTNDYYDRFAAALRMPPGSARDGALSSLNSELEQSRVNWMTSSLARAAVDLSARDEIVASQVVSLYVPNLESAAGVQDRANTHLELARLQAGLAVYRAEKGKYPETLAALVPVILEKLPIDIYHSQPYVYKRIDNGYLLYSTGPNGIDDGGSNLEYQTLEGRQAEYLVDANGNAVDPQIPGGADDFAVRVPHPTIKLPSLTLPAASR